MLAIIPLLKKVVLTDQSVFTCMAVLILSHNDFIFESSIVGKLDSVLLANLNPSSIPQIF